MNYSTLYYCAAFLALAGIPLLINQYRSNILFFGRTIIYLFLLSIYILGMMRSDGVDMANYLNSYQGSLTDGGIPDIGFLGLIKFFRFLELPIQSLFLFSAILTIYSLKRLSKFFNIQYYMLFCLYFLHLMVVRDFSQMRIGLAIALSIIGLTLNSKVKYLFYIASASIHFTSFAFSLAYELCVRVANINSRLKQFILVLSFAAFVLIVGFFIENLSFIDSRIDIYLNWDQEGYGNSVTSLGQIFMNSSILIFGCFFRKSWQHIPIAKAIFFLQILSIVSFFAFFDHAIFAFRISNILASLYPVFLLLALPSIKIRYGLKSLSQFSKIIALQLVSLCLLFRPGSYDIISAITF